MKELASALKEIEREAAEEKGPFTLFALFQREDARDLWDVVVAAPWVDEDVPGAIRYLARKMTKALSPDRMTRFSRIAPIEEKNPGLDAIKKTLQVEHGLVEVQNASFFGLPIRQAYFITTKRAA